MDEVGPQAKSALVRPSHSSTGSVLPNLRQVAKFIYRLHLRGAIASAVGQLVQLSANQLVEVEGQSPVPPALPQSDLTATTLVMTFAQKQFN